ncbi:MAG TPA: protein translocase subunit SecD [Candidatus Limnocylindrales bacterium]
MRRLLPLLILAIGLLAFYVDFVPNAKFVVLDNINGGFAQPLQTLLGLDLKGGSAITYQALPANGQQPDSTAMEEIRTIMEDRVNSSGLTEAVVQTEQNNEVVVEVPGAADAQAVADLVGQTGNLEFVLLPPAQYGTGGSSGTAGSTALPAANAAIDPTLPAQFTGSQLDPGAIAAQYDSTNGWQVAFAFKGQAATDFGTWSAAHVNDYFAIVLDSKVVSTPYIASAITNGSGVISGSFTAASAKQLATVLEYGALPYPVTEVQRETIPASLGQSFLDQTLFAGAIGICLVLLFMLVYYRLPGLVASVALTYYGLAVYALFRIIPVTLSLAGIAGFVLSVGMAVDANILIFERTKEELRTGKTLVTAVEAGFNRAWNSILDSNVSSLITASILYFGGSSTIKGFALVLIIGVATSMFTAVTMSRTLLRLVVRQQFAQKAWLFGVSDEEFQARAVGGRLGRREARGRV